MKKMLLIIVFFLSAAPGRTETPQNPEERFTTANQAFEKGNLSQAFELYRGLLQQGFGGASLYYNLGNLFYRQGNRGEAILWYERAKRFAPRDADINFNLKLAKVHLKDDKEPWWEMILIFLNGTELSLLVLLFGWTFFIVLGCSILGWIPDELWRSVALWTTGFFFVSSLVWLGFYAVWASRPYAIVTQGPGEVRNGPGLEYAVGFTVPEGSRVLILNRRPEWAQVGLFEQGLKGWMPTNAIQTIPLTSVSLN